MKNIALTFIFFCITTFQNIAQDTIQVPADYNTIQIAIDSSSNGDIVLVDEGVYYENINYKGKAITVASHFIIDSLESIIWNTVIKGCQPSNPDSGSVVYFISGEDTNSILIGFTITGGTGQQNISGGGIYCDYSGAKILNNIIIGNNAVGDDLGGASGGGIYVRNPEGSNNYIIIENNKIIYNSLGPNGARGGNSGGGIFIEHTEGIIINNVISENYCLGPYIRGGGILVAGGSPRIKNNSINNHSSATGGGIYLVITDCVVTNNIIDGNSAGLGGGGMLIIGSQPTLINNTIINNSSTYRGGGLVVDNSHLVMINSILWGNIAPTDSQIYHNPTGVSDIVYSDVQGGWAGIGNIDLYPEFVNELLRDYHLANNSPCIGAGIDSIEIGGMWYNCPIYDFEGNQRPNPSGSMPDMGAYESSFAVPVGVENDLSLFPEEYFLAQNFPNPFNPTTTIKYQIPELSFVTLKVYDVLGNEIKTLVYKEKPAGAYELTWYAEGLPSGVYFYRLQAGDFVETKKMVLMK